MSLKDKLNRLKPHLTKVAPQPTAKDDTDRTDHTDGHGPRYGPANLDLAIPFLEKWLNLSARPFIYDPGDEQYAMVREVRYPITHQHGNYRFDQLKEVITAWEASGLQHPLSAAQRTEGDLLFFDTETTGLNGGTGNTIFLLGYARFEGDSVIVRQHFLAAAHAEVALYHSFLGDVQDLNHLVTFNGKAFDWPQVKTRHTLLRDVVPKLPAFGHYDLLHGSRRMWKNELDSCRLAIIEKEKIGVSRTGDVPGSLAPILYFDYLATKDPKIIEGVLYHNEIDVLSLITLYIHLSKLLLDFQYQAVSDKEQFEIARWYDALGELECAQNIYRHIAANTNSTALQAKSMIALGHHFKKEKDWQQALQVWESALQNTAHLTEESESLQIEVAKIYEHQLKDYEKAFYYTMQAFDIWKKKLTILRQKSKSEQATYLKRIERLEKKLKGRA